MSTSVMRAFLRASAAAILCAGLIVAVMSGFAPATAAGAMPTWQLPFEKGQQWQAGSPHTPSGNNDSTKARASLDFGPSGSASKRVVAVAAGTVYLVPCGSGSYIGVDHGNGWKSTYYHLANAQKGLAGKAVAAGTYLGDAGHEVPCGGSASFDHVHLTILKDGVPTAVSGMTFGGYKVTSTGSDYYGYWTTSSGARAVTNNGLAACCLTSSTSATLKSFSAAPSPTISGTRWVDSTLTANAGTWSPSPDSKKYQWLRDGATISGATSATYRLGQSDIGKKISVKVTAVKSGYTSTSRTSGQTAAIGASTFSGTSTTPTIGGTRTQGSTLTGKPGTWTLSGATLKYQWKRNGASIAGATGLTYKLGEADIGKSITFTVSAVRTGYKTVSRTSAGTSAIKPILGNTLNAGSRLNAGQAKYSLNGKYKLVQQSDGNLVLYNLSTKKAIWATGKMYANTYTTMQTDGNLVQYRVYSSGTKAAVWATGTNGKGGNRVVVQNDGNVVIYTSAGKAVWATNTVGK